MRSIFLIVAFLWAIFFSSCQASFAIKPEILPKKISADIEFTTTGDQNRVHFSDLYEKHRASVFIFWQMSCPCVRRYQTRINHLFERYQSQDIGFYYVSSNSNEDFVDVKDEYAKRSLAIPLLRDERGEFKNAIGVKGTPSAAVIDSRGEMIFLGWIDNERGENETGRASYLENAIRDVLQNENVKVPTSPMFGCPIR